jgi:ADP-ribosylglycohydrolase
MWFLASNYVFLMDSASLINVLYLLRKTDSLVTAIHVNSLIGGDSCSRAMVIGAAFGAAGENIPDQWVQKCNASVWSEIVEASDKVVKLIIGFPSYS